MIRRDQGEEAGASLPRSYTTCSTPTYDGSGITTHPSVVDMGRRWNGYRWWLADTPFNNDDPMLENPSVWGSNDRVNWTVPHGLSNPLRMPPGGNGYHSDTQLVWDEANRQMICYWREVSNGGPFLRAMVSTNGSSWFDQQISPNSMSAGSPAMPQREDGTWWRFEYGSNAPHVYTAPAALGPWTYQGQGTLSGATETPWHGDVIRFAGRWIGVYANHASRAVYPMTSADGFAWTVGAALGGAAYRPALLPSTMPDHFDLWAGGVGGRTIYRRHHVSLWPGL